MCAIFNGVLLITDISNFQLLYFQLPRVFLNGKFIGGARDLEFLEMTGELETLLKEGKAFKPVKPL